MQFHRILSSCLVAAALVGAPLAASAQPTEPVAQVSPARDGKPAAVAEADRYAELEQRSPAAAAFEGGDRGVYIGGGALTIVLVILLVLVIL